MKTMEVVSQLLVEIVFLVGFVPETTASMIFTIYAFATSSDCPYSVSIICLAFAY